MYIHYVDGTVANFHQNSLTSDAEVQTVDTLHRTQKTAVLNTNPVFFTTATYMTLEENAKGLTSIFFSFFFPSLFFSLFWKIASAISKL